MSIQALQLACKRLGIPPQHAVYYGGTKELTDAVAEVEAEIAARRQEAQNTSDIKELKKEVKELRNSRKGGEASHGGGRPEGS